MTTAMEAGAGEGQLPGKELRLARPILLHHAGRTCAAFVSIAAKWSKLRSPRSTPRKPAIGWTLHAKVPWGSEGADWLADRRAPAEVAAPVASEQQTGFFGSARNCRTWPHVPLWGAKRRLRK
jgi:hypothetical protein